MKREDIIKKVSREIDANSYAIDLAKRDENLELPGMPPEKITKEYLWYIYWLGRFHEKNRIRSLAHHYLQENKPIIKSLIEAILS